MSATVTSNSREPTGSETGLSVTRSVWELLEVQLEQAVQLLLRQPAGTFIVTRNEARTSRVLLLRTPGSESGAVHRFPIEEEISAIHLEGSHLQFRDLLELISFHVVSRDLLPSLLRIPDAFRLPCKLELDEVAALGMKFWTMPLKPGNGTASGGAEEGAPQRGLNNGAPLEPEQPVCSIRVTSEDGALCVINPLFLSVHSDASCFASLPNLCSPESEVGALPLWNGLGNPETSGRSEAESDKAAAAQEHLGDSRSLLEEEDPEKGDSLSRSASIRRKLLFRSLALNGSENVSEEQPLTPDLPQKEVKSPHRVSWIEGIPATVSPCWPLKESGSEMSPVSESMLLPLIPELDSLSVSSMEDEGDGIPVTSPAPRKKRSSSALLTSKVFHRLSAVGSTLGGLLSAERRVSKRVQELAQVPTSYLGGLVQSFVGHILRGAGTRHPNSTEMLQEIRQMISNLKGYLCESSELCTICEHSEAEDMDLGSVVEGALYKCILKPLRDSIYAQLLEFCTRNGTVGRLQEHQAVMNHQSLAELGVTAGVPNGADLERIQAKLSLMHQAYSPKKKEMLMLKVCKMLYEAMNHTAGQTDPLGADDFLPVLIYILVNGDPVSVQLDVEYMMELMDPSQLQGEGGYYLTTWFGALYHIANFQPAAIVTRQISIEAQRSIHQWHRRRTIHHHQASRRRSQNILYISFHEPFSNQKTISVSNDMTTASVCAVCAEKYGITNPEAYGLFLVLGDSSELLAGDSCPQRLRADILQSQGPAMSFVYKPKAGVLPGPGPSSLHTSSSLATETRQPTKSVDTGQSEEEWNTDL